MCLKIQFPGMDQGWYNFRPGRCAFSNIEAEVQNANITPV